MAKVGDSLIENHLDRVYSSLLGGHSFDEIPAWITANTRIKGGDFSFLDHEYQLQILNDRTQNVNVRKCSQVGISELSLRLALAEVNIMPGFTVIYTLPTAQFSKTFTKTRFDPVIENSPKLRDALHPDNDNTEVKQFGESFIYIKGTKGTAAAISVPADHLIHDELDFSDLESVSNYQSRLTHSQYKLKTKFSTPTVDKYGISAEMNKSRRFYNVCKCDHCNEVFIPDFFKDVRVPGWDKDIREINGENVAYIDVKGATLVCPKCDKVPDLGPAHREWVCENLGGDSDTAGYQISPFDAPKIITTADLVISSTRYKRYADFINFGLGLPAEDRESALTLDDLNAVFIRAAGSGYVAHVMGIDVGQMCHVMVAGVKYGGGMDVLHAEVVPHQQLEKRKADLKLLYPIRLTVMDSQPYFDMLLRMQEADGNLWGALFSVKKDLDLYQLKRREDEEDEGKMYIRQVDVNRNRALDAVMESIRAKGILIMENECKERIVEHLTDMKRLRALTDDGEFTYQWRKSDAKNDHFHFTLLYCWLASKMTGLGKTTIVLPPIYGKMRLKVTV